MVAEVEIETKAKTEAMGRVAQAQGRGRGQVSHVRIVEEPALEDEAYDRATVHVAVDNPGAHQ